MCGVKGLSVVALRQAVFETCLPKGGMAISLIRAGNVRKISARGEEWAHPSASQCEFYVNLPEPSGAESEKRGPIRRWFVTGTKNRMQSVDGSWWEPRTGRDAEDFFTFSLSSSAVMLQELLSELLPYSHFRGTWVNAELALSKSAASKNRISECAAENQQGVKPVRNITWRICDAFRCLVLLIELAGRSGWFAGSSRSRL